MPIVKGRRRRRRLGRGNTVSATHIFVKSDMLWIQEQATLREESESLILADAIEVYRREMHAKLVEVEREARRAKHRADKPDTTEGIVIL